MTEISFKINGKEHTINGKYGPDFSLNEYIRSVADLRGTKSMCHEGGCGACVVAVKALNLTTNEMKTFAVNSCLVSILSCHGWEITTVEGIGNRTIGYHDIQTRLADFNGTQCGYCTPGWVMNMYSLHESKSGKLTMKEIENSFAGNMCRCTGYRPIADAFKSLATDADERLLNKICEIEDLSLFKKCGVSCLKKCSHDKTKSCNKFFGEYSMMTDKAVKTKNEDLDWCFMNELDKKMIVIDCGTHKWYKAFTLSDVFEVISKGDDYKFVAGNTGQGVYHVTDYPPNVIDIFNVKELKGHIIDVNLVLGAGMSLSDMMDVFLKLSEENEDFSYLKQLHEHMDLVAHIPVRNIGTIGGNLFLKHTNNDFQSDVFLIFETVEAMVTIAEGVSKQKSVTMLDFLKTDMKGKIMVNVMLPPLSQCCLVKTYKIMPRSQNAHAAVNAGFLFKFSKKLGNRIEKANLVFGSISGSFNRATKTEAVLVGKDLFTNETLQLAIKTLLKELSPEDAKPEPSAAYRKMLAVSLFYKAILSLSPEDKVDKKYRSGGTVFKRETSNGTQTFDTDKSVWPLNQPIPKLEALVQCAGEATFANDLPTQVDEVFGSFVIADATPGSKIESFDASEALKMPGVLAFYTAKDIPGDNTFTPSNVPLMVESEEILCSSTIKYHSQPVAIIVANREKTANKAAKLVKVKYSSLNTRKPLLTIEDVIKSPEKDNRVVINKTLEPKEKGNDVSCVVYGKYVVGSQYHYTMEPQTCVTKPTEDGLDVYAATQWLDLCNLAVAQSLNVPVNSVQIIVRRVGGAYGAKITRATQVACASALVSKLLGRTCRFVLPLMTNMSSIGKRCSASADIEVGVNKEGQIQYLKNTFYEDNGWTSNDTISPMTLLHFMNCYDTKRWFVEAGSVLTDTPCTTWCRAPGSTEGVAMIEFIMEKIAFHLNLDPIQVRLQNIKEEDNPIPELIQQIMKVADFENRKAEVSKFNSDNRWKKRAIKLIPLLYDFFYFGNYNTIISIYHGDGSVSITHGGVEMGQGINTKTAQVCAHILGAPIEKMSVKPTSSLTSPNAMVTGGSVGSDCVPFAAMKACQILLERFKPIKEQFGNIPWTELINKAYASGIDLQASYMYSGKDNLKGYDVYAVAVLEVEVDILTGNHDVRRVDLLEDTGKSMNPEIDVGQIEGSFIMGLGYWTSENLIYDDVTGELLTNRTWTYKPPGIKDIPADMRVYFRRNSENPAGVLQSKATGEPAFCLAVIVTHAIREAVMAARKDAGYQEQWLDIPHPYTIENIFMAVGHKLEHFKLK